MSGPWEYFQKGKHAPEQKADDASPFQSYTAHPGENKPTLLQGGVQKLEEAVPQRPPEIPRQQQYVPAQPQYAPIPRLQGDTGQTRLPAGLEEFREKDGYDINGYVGKYGERMPLIAGFKRQVTNYTVVNMSEDEDINALMTMVQGYGRARGFHVPSTNITVLHQFDMVVPADLPDKVPLNFHYRRLDESERQVDTTRTQGELYTDYSIDGRAHRYFIGLANFTLLDGSQSHSRAVVIPLERYYPNRSAEINDMKRWFSSGRPGDDEAGKQLPNFYSLPPKFQNLLKSYPSNPNQ